MQAFDITVPQGDSLDLVIGPVTVADPVTKVVSPIDLTQASLKLWLTAKLAIGDPDPGVIQKTVGVGGGPGGITVNVPTSTDKNYATAAVTKTETAAVAANTSLQVDVQLEEPNGRKTTLAKGIITVVGDVTDA